MTSHLEPAISYQKDKSEETCNNCGARFEVVVTGQKGHEQSENYRCPECTKEFTVRASLPPTVRLIAPRTDGKTDLYKADAPKE